MWEQEKILSLKDFLLWYKNRDLLPTMEAMQKIVELYHNKWNNTFKFGGTLTNLAIIVCTVLTVQNFIHSQKLIKVCFQKFKKIWLENRENCLHVKPLSTKLKSANVWKLFVHLNASQLHALLMCESMSRGFYTRYEFDEVLQGSSPVRTYLENSKISSYCIFNEWDRTAELRASTQQELGKMLIV